MFQKKILHMAFNKLKGANFAVTYWDGQTDRYGVDKEQEPEFRIIFNEKLDLNEIRKQPQLKLGEAYMRGDIDLKGNLKEVLKVLNSTTLSSE